MIYAKSEPIETLRQHTDELRKQMGVLKDSYEDKISCLGEEKEVFWQYLDIAIEFHDMGKLFTPFQNVIREKIGEPLLETALDNNVNHNYISPALIDYRSIDVPRNKQKIITHAIAFHHERNVDISSEFIEKVKIALSEDIFIHVKQLEDEFQSHYPVRTKKLDDTFLSRLKNRIQPEDDDYLLYIMLKGMLHKLDHSASAHEVVELDSKENVGMLTEQFILNDYDLLRPVQEFAKANRDKNVILIASTGMGKTETALIWIDDWKAFFTLPLRVSINALFDRVSEKQGINYPYAGLLHSTSMEYLEDKQYEGWESIVDTSKLLSKKLTFSTIDQVFKFPFLYRGYEKVYATLAYSKVVIDEIQAYSPEIAAVLIKGLELIHRIGGKFMVMTATMPTIYIDEMKKRGLFDDQLVMKEFNNEVVRHHLKIIDQSLDVQISEIYEKGRDKKVLVIVNTVKDAIDLFEKLMEENEAEEVEIRLLHSMYIAEDRSLLEKQIIAFAKDQERHGIWITTQLVEASLDIDFDILYTQISTLDSLFQRLGRCNRKGVKHIDEPNIMIFTENVSGIGTIYDEEIVTKGLDLLRTAIDQDACISEQIKVELVRKLYNKESLEGTAFYTKFNKALHALDIMVAGALDNREAQDILRGIESVTAIPRQLFDEMREGLIQEYENIGDQLKAAYEQGDKQKQQSLKIQRRTIRKQIMKKTVNIPAYKLCGGYRQAVSPIEIKGIENLYILEYEYDVVRTENEQLIGRGVLLGKELSQFI